MSHFTKLEKAKVVDPSAFIAACSELGMKEVSRDVKIRPWAEKDAAMQVDIFCSFGNQSKYGIALVKDENANSFSMVSDWSLTGHDLPKAIKAKMPHSYQFPGEDREVAIEGHGVARTACDEFRGLVLQLTTKHTIVSRYRRLGFTAKVTEKQDKSLHVTLTR